MKNFVPVLLILILSACSQPKQSEDSEEVLVDNEELKRIYSEDQDDRKTSDIDWGVVSQRDSERQARVTELLDSGLVNTSADYANAAMIFQHGYDTIASGMAVSLMRKAIELDTTADKWLLAAAIDRDLMRRGEPQIYGTQFVREGEGPWELYMFDSTKISDEERKEYGVETLEELKEKVKRINKD